MKKFFLFALVATALAACSTDPTQDLAPEIPTAPDELYVSFDEDSRVQLDADCKTVWTKDDLVSVFYYSDANDCWRFKGETGDRNGLLIRKTSTTPTIVTDEVVVVYPYNADYRLATSDKTLSVRIPAVQHYEAGSYGVGANLMVSTGTSNNFSLKSVCGWIKLQFTGSGKVTKVTLRGNDDEQIAGLATINYADYSLSLIADGLGDAANNDEVGGTLVDDADYVREITLDCGEGIALNNKTPTAFYFVLAPQTFTQGITITATCDDGTEITKSTENAITIERNHILPMASATLEMPIPSNQIWYTSSDGNVVEPYSGNLNSNATAMQTFGANIVSNTYENGVGVITFDGDVTTIGDWAFYDCDALTSITIPDSVTTIGEKAFIDCSALTSITIPDSVRTIGYAAFGYCFALTSVTTPDSVTTIEGCAFYGCGALTSVTIPDSVTTIGEGAFGGCDALKAFYGKFASADNRCWIVNGVLNSFAPAGLTEYTIPDSVTTIGDYAFQDCHALKSVTIPDSVTTIGREAFYSCHALTSVTIPDSVTTIGDSAFIWCNALKSVTIPDSVTKIGHSAFNSCDALTSVTIPDSVTTIEDYTFRYCSALTSVTIPDSVTKIGDWAFSDCDALTSVTIPDSVTKIGNYAFYDCSALKEVYCKPTTPPSLDGSSVFDSNASGRKIYVPTASVDAYKAKPYWRGYASEIYPYTFTE